MTTARAGRRGGAAPRRYGAAPDAAPRRGPAGGWDDGYAEQGQDPRYASQDDLRAPGPDPRYDSSAGHTPERGAQYGGPGYGDPRYGDPEQSGAQYGGPQRGAARYGGPEPDEAPGYDRRAVYDDPDYVAARRDGAIGYDAAGHDGAAARGAAGHDAAQYDDAARYDDADYDDAAQYDDAEYDDAEYDDVAEYDEDGYEDEYDPEPRPDMRWLLIAVAAGTLVSVGLGVYGRLHTPTGAALNLAGFSSGLSAKAWLGSLAFVFALVQLFTAVRGHRPGAGPRLWLVHRWSGRIAVLVTVPIAVHCLYALGFSGGTTRALVHSLFGCLLYGAFVAKMLVLQRPGAPRWSLPLLGGLLFTAITVVWLTSSLWFFSTSGLIF